MRRTLVYDLPTRLFHWFFSGLFLLAFVIAKTVNDESLIFSYHMLSGLLLGCLVVWRIVWGFVGSEHARFSGFSLSPHDLKDYFWGILSGSKKRWSGHNPASSWVAIVMFTLALGLAITGYLMSTGGKEAFEDIHELLANSFIVVVLLHLTGIALHWIRHQDVIALSMIDGKKDISGEGTSISSSRRWAALLLVGFMTFIGTSLVKNFDSKKRTLNVFGQTLQLGDNEESQQEIDEEKENHDDGDFNGDND